MASKPQKPVKGTTARAPRIKSKMDAPEGLGLTVPQAMFVAYYFGEAKLNQAKAAEMCGYADPVMAGYDLMQLPTVRAAIKAKLDSAAMGVEEVLARFTEVARSSIEDALSRGPAGWRADLDKVHRLGKMHLIRKVTPTKYGIAVEMYSSERALDKLARFHGLYHDKVTVDINHKVDLTRLPNTPEVQALLKDFAAQKMELEEFQEAVHALTHNPSHVIEGEGMVHEVPETKKKR